MTINGKTLIDWGFKPGDWFKKAIEAAEKARLDGYSEEAIKQTIQGFMPPPVIGLRDAFSTHDPYFNIRAENDDEVANIKSVTAHMYELMRLPTVVKAAVMPDACPSDKKMGTIPVGGIVSANNAIHPGMHSADICCSMAITVFDTEDATGILDAAMEITHFGPGGRSSSNPYKPEYPLLENFEINMFLQDKAILSASKEHFATQGDGNHFLYVGRLASTGHIALVTHHGSRKPGALLYKKGMAAAEALRKKIAPEIPAHNAWLIADSEEGEEYWDALQMIREWTKQSHFKLHDLIARKMKLRGQDRFWNEHNFVFQKSDGLFYHAKGATPAYSNFAIDDSGFTLIPLNMAEPILITRGLDAINGLGFSPHGAGRNYSRSEYLRRTVDRTTEELLKEQTAGIDVRFYCGKPDVSELPGAYKNAETVVNQIVEYGLAEITDRVLPIGSIMAGDWEHDMPWKKKKRNKEQGVKEIL